MKTSIDDILGTAQPTNPRSMLAAISRVYGALAKAGEAGVPAGHIYTALMASGCTLQQYEEIEALMLRTGLVNKTGDVLRANDPAKGKR